MHGYIDELPEAEVDRVSALVRAVHENNRPLITALTAPIVDDEEMAWIDATLREDDASDADDQRTYSAQEVRHELGLA